MIRLNQRQYKIKHLIEFFFGHLQYHWKAITRSQIFHTLFPHNLIFKLSQLSLYLHMKCLTLSLLRFPFDYTHIYTHTHFMLVIYPLSTSSPKNSNNEVMLQHYLISNFETHLNISFLLKIKIHLKRIVK